MRYSRFAFAACVLLTLQAFGQSVAHGEEGAPGKSESNFDSPQAKNAQQKYKSTLSIAEETYFKSLRAAQNDYIELLKSAKAAAMKAEDLDEANRIAVELAPVEDELKQTKSLLSAGRGRFSQLVERDGELLE